MNLKRTRLLFSDFFFVLLIVLLVVASFLSYRRINRLNEAYSRVNHSNLVKLKLEQVLSSMKEAEISEREYLLMNDSSALTPLRGARDKTISLINELDSLTNDNPKQQHNVNSLLRLAELRYGRLFHVTGLAYRDTAIVYPMLRDGNQVAARLNERIADMNSYEERIAIERREEKDSYALFTPFYVLLFTLLAVGIVTTAYFRLRKETQLRIRAEDSESEIHTFFMQVPAMVAILNGPDHVVEFANQSLTEFIGQRNIAGSKIREAMPEISSQGYFELLDEVYVKGEIYVGKEKPLQISRAKEQGENFYINFTLQPFTSINGKKRGILVFCYDVTEMVAARKKIETLEQRHRLALEAGDIGTFDWDFVNKDFISSQRVIEIFGFSDPATTHQDLIAALHPDDKPNRDKAVEESYEKGSLVYEARVVLPDKRYRWVSVYGKVFYDSNRVPLRMYGTVIDITEQKTVLETIRESENKFRLLADSMPQQIWTSDANGSIDYYNDAVYSFSGLSFNDLVGSQWVDIIHPDDREENIKRWQQAIVSGDEYFMEHRFRHRSGEYRWQLSRALPQKTKDGAIQRWVGTSTDIHDQRNFMDELEKLVKERTQSVLKTNQQLKETVEELRKTNQELESFNSIASHDLQEPLRKIMAFSQRITSDEKNKLTGNSIDYFNRITAAAARMRNLIDSFLTYSGARKDESAFEEADLALLLEEVKSELALQIEEYKVSIRYDSLPVLHVIPIQIRQLFINLISNSIKYRKENVDPVITIVAEKVAGDDLILNQLDRAVDYYRIILSDNGIGFEQQYAEKIFQLFQRLHGRTAYSGTGIGLTICKKIMSNHGGYIFAKGFPGEGAAFHIYLPAK